MRGPFDHLRPARSDQADLSQTELAPGEKQVSLNSTAAPARGTRPRNRRALILRAATDLFHRRGYDHVGMGDIAAAVAIGPSALYRHFPGKQQLLHAVILDGLAPVRELLAELDLTDRATALPAIARLGLEHRELGVLWQREARHVAEDDRVELRSYLRELGQSLTSRVKAARPELSSAAADLLTWAMVATVTSNSFHHLDLPRPDYEELLVDLLTVVLDTDVPLHLAEASQPRHSRALVPKSRREALLTQAIRMFAAQGYTGVGIEDIGAAAGITGPSFYNHFDSKLDLLLTALTRGTAALYMDLSSIYATATTATEALRRLTSSYIRFTADHHNHLDLLITETEHLPADKLHEARQAQHSYIDEWVHLLRSVHPQIDPTTARIRVHAALAVANDIARTPHLRRNADVPNALELICTRMLHLV